MSGNMSEDRLIDVVDCMVKVCIWTFLQVVVYFLMPYLWNYGYAVGALSLILLYTVVFVIYGKVVGRDKIARRLYRPYLVYLAIGVVLYYAIDSFVATLWTILLLPFFGATCFVCYKCFKRFLRRMRERHKGGGLLAYLVLVLIFVVLKFSGVCWSRIVDSTAKGEEVDIIERRDYLSGKLLTSPQAVLDAMPSAIGTQFQGEWALYSCSMFSASLLNISYLYPETKADNLQYIDQLIRIVMSPEIRLYDAQRWGEDPLETLNGELSHVSYLSHLAWMICNYKELGGDGRYDELLSKLCATMNRRILASEALNLPTYPNEPIYVPDMLVAIVALNKYADMYDGKYRSTVHRWVSMAKRCWHDEDTGLLVSFLTEDGSQYGYPVKGSYSALNCYYLTFIDKSYAQEQYLTLKSKYWRGGLFSGLKEYRDRPFFIGPDIDAGVIFFGLSPSGTAFFTGPSTYFCDTEVSGGILSTAEFAGHTIRLGSKRHYLLADIALVGEAIMLAMRTHVVSD